MLNPLHLVRSPRWWQLVLAGYWLTPLGLGPGPELLIIFLSTIAGCALTYELGRRVAVLRPFVGLKARRPESVMPASLATA